MPRGGARPGAGRPKKPRPPEAPAGIARAIEPKSKNQPIPPAETLADFLARPHDVAIRTLGRAVIGALEPKTLDGQRRAALDVLGGAMWQHLTDEQLRVHAQHVAAEITRRKAMRSTDAA
jgi:hypothetical protein